MEKSSNTNLSNSTKLPRVDLFIIGQQKVEQSYGNVNIIKLSESHSFAKTYNTAKPNQESDVIYGYLLPYHNFTNPDSLKNIVAKLLAYQQIFGVYTNSINTNNVPQYYPTYNPSSILSQFIINPPLFAKQPLEFNEEIEHLIFYEVLKRGCNKLLWYCMPYMEILLSNFHVNCQQDLQLLQQ